MCNPVHADIIVIIKSKFDGKWWIITNNEVERLDDDQLSKLLEGCESTASVTYCYKDNALIVWSRRGKAGIGLRGVEPEDPDVWCNLARLAELLKEKLPEPVLVVDIYGAASELLWGLAARKEVAMT